MKEEDIRPLNLLQPFLDLSKRDAVRLFGSDRRHVVPCVACGDSNQSFEFSKQGFAYVTCDVCGTLFNSPRASIEQFEAFYRESESWQYWSEVYFPAVAEARRLGIFRPRVQTLEALVDDKKLDVKTLLEVGCGYGLFLEEWRSARPGTNIFGIEPSPSLAEACRGKGFEICEDVAENVITMDGKADLVVCFEVLEHVFNPVEFLRVLARFAKPGGYVLISTLGFDGFDLQVLREQSQSIFPPHHINFPTVSGIHTMFMRAGFDDVNVTTPGKLDVDIVRNASLSNEEILKGQPFLRRIVNCEDLGGAFQEFLVENMLSSHMWALGRKSSM